MKIRTDTQAHDFLAEDLIWRKKELTALRFLLEGATIRNEKFDALLRGCVTMLYAHWEGYIKSASITYLSFVSNQRVTYEQLSPNFIAIAARGILRKASAARTIRTHIELTQFFLTGLAGHHRGLPESAISTRANLSSTVLTEIMDTLGLDPRPFESKAHLLDEGLLEARNTIAHGEYLQVTPDRYQEFYAEILAMMDQFRTQIQNSIALRAYLAKGTTAAAAH